MLWMLQKKHFPTHALALIKTRKEAVTKKGSTTQLQTGTHVHTFRDKCVNSIYCGRGVRRIF